MKKLKELFEDIFYNIKTPLDKSEEYQSLEGNYKGIKDFIDTFKDDAGAPSDNLDLQDDDLVERIIVLRQIKLLHLPFYSTDDGTR